MTGVARTLLLTGVALMTTTASLASQGAQGRAGQGARAVSESARPGRGRAQPTPARIARERMIEERFLQLVRDSLRLNTDQMGKVRDIDVRFARQRLDLEDQERRIRRELRDMMAVRGTPVDQDGIGHRWDRLLVLQRMRLNLLEREDRDLTTVLNPLQRVQYHGMRDNLRLRIDQLLENPSAVSGPDGRGRRGGPPTSRDTTGRG